MSELKSYPVWDAPTRWFHWINAICVAALVVVGYLILNGRALEVSRAGSLTLKTIHTWIGYVFAVNLLVRIGWAFVGNRYARWRAVLPGGRGYLSAVRSYVRAFVSRHPEEYLGHNPLGRLSVTTMLVLIIILAISGLVLAGTDLFYPPIGHWIAHWVAAPGVDPGTLVPGTPDMYDKAAFDSMRSFRKPFLVSHLYAYYALLVVVALHVAGVVITEIREGGNLISATFTGRKIISGRPVDEEQSSGG
jgi:Ni/Fe-hydrogenase 1 B-type cytochrome subunit